MRFAAGRRNSARLFASGHTRGHGRASRAPVPYDNFSSLPEGCSFHETGNLDYTGQRGTSRCRGRGHAAREFWPLRPWRRPVIQASQKGRVRSGAKRTGAVQRTVAGQAGRTVHSMERQGRDRAVSGTFARRSCRPGQRGKRSRHPGAPAPDRQQAAARHRRRSCENRTRELRNLRGVFGAHLRGPLDSGAMDAPLP